MTPEEIDEILRRAAAALRAADEVCRWCGIKCWRSQEAVDRCAWWRISGQWEPIPMVRPLPADTKIPPTILEVIAERAKKFDAKMWAGISYGTITAGY